MFVCPASHMAIRKARQGKKDGEWNQAWTYYFDVEKCKACAHREGCYKNGAKSKTYSVPIRTGEQERLMEVQKTPEFKAKARERYKIEAKNAELKHVLAMTGQNLTDYTPCRCREPSQYLQQTSREYSN